MINFQDLDAVWLGRFLATHPSLADPLMALCEVGPCAIRRDLGLSASDLHGPRSRRSALMALAGYLKPLLPDRIEPRDSPADGDLRLLERQARMSQDQWEAVVRNSFAKAARRLHFSGAFAARHITLRSGTGALQLTHPASGTIQVAVLAKRAELRGTLRKKCDEILRVVSIARCACPAATFVAFIHHPYSDQHIHALKQLRSGGVTRVVFASDHPESILNAALFGLRMCRA